MATALSGFNDLGCSVLAMGADLQWNSIPHRYTFRYRLSKGAHSRQEKTSHEIAQRALWFLLLKHNTVVVRYNSSSTDYWMLHTKIIFWQLKHVKSSVWLFLHFLAIFSFVHFIAHCHGYLEVYLFNISSEHIRCKALDQEICHEGPSQPCIRKWPV